MILLAMLDAQGSPLPELQGHGNDHNRPGVLEKGHEMPALRLKQGRQVDARLVDDVAVGTVLLKDLTLSQYLPRREIDRLRDAADISRHSADGEAAAVEFPQTPEVAEDRI